MFTASTQPSHVKILDLLEANPPDTIEIIAIGPLTNLALAASQAPQTFLRAKSVIVMGGTIVEPGNITPVGEFNILADPTAAARVFALTSPNPASTMPPTPVNPVKSNLDETFLPPYPAKEQIGDRRLNLKLFPLDITTSHVLLRNDFEERTEDLLEQGSPLADWAHGFLGPTFRKMESLHHGQEGEDVSLSLHDPLCVWFAIWGEDGLWTFERGEDIRIETAGQWTRGMCVTDKRDRKMRDHDDGDDDGDVPGDTGCWLSQSRGNRIDRCVETPGRGKLAPYLLRSIFGK